MKRTLWAAGVIFLLRFFPVFVQIGLVKVGVFHFRAAYFANRVGAVLSVVVLFFILITALKRVRLTYGEFFYLLYLCIEALWGWYQGNPLADILADVGLLGMPLAFIWWGRLLWEELHGDFSSFLSVYLWLNLGLLVPLILLVYFQGYSWLIVDNAIVIGMLDAMVLFGGFRGIFALPWLAMTVAFAVYKVTFVQLAVNWLAFFTRKDFTPKLFRRGTLLIVLALGGLALGVGFHRSVGGRKAQLLLQKVEKSTTHMSKAWEEPFEYLDPSTAERIFEFRQVVHKIETSIWTEVFGVGLGGGVDLQDTKDQSVVWAHGGRENLKQVRVIHLGVGFALLKGGWVGLLIYFGIACWACWKALHLVIREHIVWWKVGAGLAVLNYIIGTLFTFAFWVKNPMFWVLIGGLLHGNDHQVSPSNRIGEWN